MPSWVWTLARSLGPSTLGRTLGQRPATRAELFAELAARGIDPAGQRGIHLVRHAALHGLLVCGPDQGHEQTWIRREASTTQPVDDREEALAMLARRYHSAYGPAGPRDLAAWSGLRSPRHSAPGGLQVTCPGRRTVLAVGRQRSGCSRISIRICSATPVVTTRFLPGTGAGSGPAAGTCCRPWFATGRPSPPGGRRYAGDGSPSP